MSLDWAKFKSLAGADTDNFEKLCRSIIKRKYAQYGNWNERKSQPGVEFSLVLNEKCELGSKGDIIGWQCKWFELNADVSLKAASKALIIDSLNKTKKHLHDLNKWFLWLPYNLTAGDLRWFEKLRKDYDFQMNLLTDSDVEDKLTGSAVELRATFFGEFALTPEVLQESLNLSIEPIKGRWVYAVHQKVDAEQDVRRFLGESTAWNYSKELNLKLQKHQQNIELSLGKPEYSEWKAEFETLVECTKRLAEMCDFFSKNITADDKAVIQTIFDETVQIDTFLFHNILRRLRRRNLPLSLTLTNILAYVHDIREMLADAIHKLEITLVSVLAVAGGGKTHLAVSIAKSSDGRPAGVLIQGKNLKKGGTLDDLAKSISFGVNTVPSFRMLVSAIDAAAERGNCRIPLVIDGLNEAEDPRDWKDELIIARELLQYYPNVLLLVTLRTGEKNSNHSPSSSRETFAEMALPEDCIKLESNGFGELTYVAVQTYFDYYKINANIYNAPRDFFSHPLNLRIFCDVTNPSRKVTKDAHGFPASLSSLFSQQQNHIINSIVSMKNISPRYSGEEVKNCLYYIGLMLWEGGSRDISEKKYLKKIGQKSTPWERNIVNLLSQEGILFRNPGDKPNKYVLTIVYDRLAGFMIADSLSQTVGVDWFDKDNVIEALLAGGENRHWLSQDILLSLLAIFPSCFKKQFWEVVPIEYVDSIIELSTYIEGSDLNELTVDKYQDWFLNKPSRASFNAMKRIRSTDHPLNSEFFFKVMKQLPLSVRDLSWTEYIRENEREYLNEIDAICERWQERFDVRTHADKLIALWILWVLSSSSHSLRDAASKALYNYGKGNQSDLFDMALDSLDINDPYIVERMLAVSFGVVSFHYHQKTISNELISFSNSLFERVFSNDADYFTSNIRIRNFASNIIQLCKKTFPEDIDQTVIENSLPPYALQTRLVWGGVKERGFTWGRSSPFGRNFENYTIGGLVQGRSNYDFDHEEYCDVRGRILWRVKDLGWNSEDFTDVDQRIAEINSRSYRSSPSKVDRYGKKYSWISYNEMLGHRIDTSLLDRGELRFSIDIDPNFPDIIDQDINLTTNLLGNNSVSNEDWVCDSNIPNISTVDEFASSCYGPGESVVLNCFFLEKSNGLGREIWFKSRVFLIDNDGFTKLKNHYEKNGISDLKIPKINHLDVGLAGQIHLFDRDSDVSKAIFQIKTGSNFEERTLPVVQIDRKDGFRVSIDAGNTQVSRYEIPIFDSINAFCPICEFSNELEESSCENISGDVLSYDIYNDFQLQFDVERLRYFDLEGGLAACNVKSGDGWGKNHYSGFHIKKELIESFARDNDLKIIRYIEGERQLLDTTNYTKFTKLTFEL